MNAYGIDQLKDSMVKILESDGQTVLGSGFILRSDGYIITCHHLIYKLDSIKVEYQKRPYDAHWCEELSDLEVDIAILKIEIKSAKPVPIINPKNLSTSVTVYGFPQTAEVNFPQGFDVHARNIHRSASIKTVSTYPKGKPNLKSPWNKLPKIESIFLSHRIEAGVDPGTSGGPVFSEDLGGVVGVIQCSKKNISYAIRWDNITKTLDRLGLEPHKNTILQFLEYIQDHFKYLKFFHSQKNVIIEDQYIPIEVTSERRYRHEVKSFWGYAESEEELKRAYAMKGSELEFQLSQVPWNEAKKKSQKIMVLADPGMGKSTLLKMETRLTAQEESKKLRENQKNVNDVVFPIFLRLSDLSKNEEEVIDVVPLLINRDYPKIYSRIDDFIAEKLKDGKCILLLDALDEVPKEHRKHLSDKLNRFAKNYSCPIISTSRIVGYAGVFLEGIKEVEIVPFNQKQVDRYVKAWFTNAAATFNNDSVTAEGLLQEIQSKPQIKGLTQNPLLLSLLCSLYQEKQLSLPARRCQIYEKAVHAILKDWPMERKELDEGRVIVITSLLEDLAFRFTCESKDIFSASELHEKIEKYLKSERVLSDLKDSQATRLMTELSEEYGILQKLEKEQDRYIFLHRTFQEFMTASYLMRIIKEEQHNGINIARQHLWEYDWHEILALLAGLMKDPIPLLYAIKHEKDDIFRSQLILAGQCISECEENSHPLVNELCHQIYNLWIKYPFVEYINSTFVEICQANSEMFKKLSEAIEHENSTVRYSAAENLIKVGTQEAVEVLMEAVSHYNFDVRLTASEALSKMGNPHAVDLLIKTLGDEDRGSRSEVVKALGRIGNLQTLEALINALKHEDSDLRSSAAKALIDALAYEEIGGKSEAVKMLGKIESSQAIELLIETLKHKDIDTASAAAKALGRIGNPQAVEPLIEALNHEDIDVTSTAATALGRIGNLQAVEPLIEALNHEDYLVVMGAAEALGRIGNPQAIDALIEKLNDEDEYIRMGVAEYLAKTGNPQAIETVLNHEDVCVSYPAEQALKDISEVNIHGWLNALRNGDSDIRLAAVAALGKIGNPHAIEDLMRALKDNDRWVRTGAAWGLGRIGNLECFEKLIGEPEIDIYNADFFLMLRNLAVKHSKEKTAFIPVYPELIRKGKGTGIRNFLIRIYQKIRLS